jgi:hypothetical protein
MLTLEMAIQKIQQLPPEQQRKAIAFIEKLEFQSNQGANPQISQEPKKISFAEAAREFIGCLDSEIEDLSHNPKYLEGFGE